MEFEVHQNVTVVEKLRNFLWFYITPIETYILFFCTDL